MNPEAGGRDSRKNLQVRLEDSKGAVMQLDDEVTKMVLLAHYIFCLYIYIYIQYMYIHIYIAL